MTGLAVDPGEVLAGRCLELMRSAGSTLATAESLTAGLVTATLASVPGASDVLRGGLVAYATDVKTSVLGVDPDLVATYGVVSGECASAMARRALDLFDATWAVSATGVAGPNGQDGKPAGTVYVGVAGPGAEAVRQLALTGTRSEVRRMTVLEALTLLVDEHGAVSPAG